MLATDLAAAFDPVIFSRRAGLEPDDWQAEVLRSTSDRMLLNCSRQSGKSTTAGTLAMHTAAYSPGSLTLLLSPSLRQSQELFRKVLDAFRTLDDAVPSEAESALRLELANGSRIISLPGTERTIRGYSGVNLLIVDEASRVDDALYYSVRPMLAVSGGRLIAMSTPYGRRGWWFDAWHGDQEWQRFEVPAERCPRISPDFLQEELETLGEWLFQQEYGCQFRDATDAVFKYEDVAAAFSDTIEPLFLKVSA